MDNVNFEDARFWADKDSNPYMERMLRHLAVCHTVVVDERTGKYNASSPDELALVNAAKFFGSVFVKRDEESHVVVRQGEEERRYRLLNILEFTSNRKRMSVVVEQDNQLYLLTKGADTVLFPRVKATDPILESTKAQVDVYAREGLRTLLLAERRLEVQEYMEWNTLFEEAMARVDNRDEEVARVCDQLEQGLQLVGATAIEDKLQEGVQETIRFIKEAGIKVWVLTGDKVETAVNIGFSSGLIDNSMRLFTVTAKFDAIGILSELSEAYAEIHKGFIQKSGLIVDGETLFKIFEEDKLKEEFLNVAT